MSRAKKKLEAAKDEETQQLINNMLNGYLKGGGLNTSYVKKRRMAWIKAPFYVVGFPAFTVWMYMTGHWIIATVFGLPLWFFGWGTAFYGNKFSLWLIRNTVQKLLYWRLKK